MAKLIEHSLYPREFATGLLAGPAHFTLFKDADYEIEETWEGEEDLTGGSITWLIAAESVDLSGDLESISTELSISTGGGGIAIDNGIMGVFTCTIADSDTEGIAPGRYIVVPRLTLSGSDILPAASYPITILA